MKFYYTFIYQCYDDKQFGYMSRALMALSCIYLCTFFGLCLVTFLFLHFLPYFVSSSAKFNYKLVVILLEMLMKAKNIDEHIKKYTCLQSKRKEIRCTNFKNKGHDMAKLTEKNKDPKKVLQMFRREYNLLLKCLATKNIVFLDIKLPKQTYMRNQHKKRVRSLEK